MAWPLLHHEIWMPPQKGSPGVLLVSLWLSLVGVWCPVVRSKCLPFLNWSGVCSTACVLFFFFHASCQITVIDWSTIWYTRALLYWEVRLSMEPHLPQLAQSVKAMQQRAHDCIDHELHHPLPCSMSSILFPFASITHSNGSAAMPTPSLEPPNLRCYLAALTLVLPKGWVM